MRWIKSAFIPVVSLFAAVAAAPTDARAETVLERGEYLVTIMDCTGCHTPGALVGAPDMDRFLGGAETGFGAPGVGVFYPPNLTSDPETGLGKWSVQEIADAVRTGVRPDGRALFPIMPFPSYAALTDEDAIALATYLKTVPPVKHKAPGPFGPDDKPTAPYSVNVDPK